MKYISYCVMAIVSTVLVIVLSLSSCSPNSKATNSSVASSAQEQPQTAPTATPSPTTADATVKIHNFKFEPANLSIAVGKTVQFVNVDEEPHTATSTDGMFNSKALDSDQTWTYTATKPGTYPYICSIHPFMKGTLTVTP